MQRVFAFLAALLVAAPAFAFTMGDDGLHKTDWMRDTFKDLREDLAEATAEGKRLAVIIEQRGCIYCTKMHETVFPVPEIDALIRENYYFVQINMFGDVVMGVGHEHFEGAMSALKTEVGAKADTDLTAGQLKGLTEKYLEIYRRHTGYPGGLREISAESLLAKHPERLVEYAVWGMLPKGPLGRQMYRKLKVYRGEQHPHAAQKPQSLSIPEAAR